MPGRRLPDRSAAQPKSSPIPSAYTLACRLPCSAANSTACPRMAAFRPSGRSSRSAAPRKTSSSATGSTRQLRRRPAAPAGAAADDGNSSSDPAASAAQSSAARPNVFQNAAVSCFSFTHSPPIGGHCTTSAPICASRRAVLRKCEEIFAQTIDFFPLHLV